MENIYVFFGIQFDYERVSENYIKSYLREMLKEFNKMKEPLQNQEKSIKIVDDFFNPSKTDKLDKENAFNLLVYLMSELKKIKEPEKIDEIIQKYDKIRNEEKRQEYALERKYQQKENVYNMQLNNYLYTQEQLNKPNYTKYASNFPEGIKTSETVPYRWGCELNRDIDLIIDGINQKDERVIITDLGKFYYEAVGRTTAEYPDGKPYFSEGIEGVNIIGVTKFNDFTKTEKTDVVICRLNPEDKWKNEQFFREIFVSDELIDSANRNNAGFIGEISTEVFNGIPEYFIEYNSPFDVKLVSALNVANQTKGSVKEKGGSGIANVENFAKLKEKLASCQQVYAVNMLKSNDNLHKEGEIECQK